MISHDFVQTGFFGLMINNAKCSWYFSHLILAPCPGLVKRLTKLISQPATLKLKENIKRNHIGAKVSSSFLSQGFNNFIHLHFWPRFKSHPDFSALKTTGFNNQRHEVTWSSEESRRFMSFHVQFGFKNLKQNTESKAGQSGKKISTVLCSPRVTCVTFWCWYWCYDLMLRVTYVEYVWLRWYDRVVDRAEHIAFVSVQTSESVTALLCGQLLERKRSAWSLKERLFGIFFERHKMFCVVLFDYVLWSTILQHLFWCLAMSIHKKQST